jgi:hypothetical protein
VPFYSSAGNDFFELVELLETDPFQGHFQISWRCIGVPHAGRVEEFIVIVAFFPKHGCFKDGLIVLILVAGNHDPFVLSQQARFQVALIQTRKVPATATFRQIALRRVAHGSHENFWEHGVC